jgi:hypothetical protein
MGAVEKRKKPVFWLFFRMAICSCDERVPFEDD